MNSGALHPTVSHESQTIKNIVWLFLLTLNHYGVINAEY